LGEPSWLLAWSMRAAIGSEEEIFVGWQARAPAPAQAVVSDGAWLDASGTSAVAKTKARTERGSQRKELLINQLTLRLRYAIPVKCYYSARGGSTSEGTGYP